MRSRVSMSRSRSPLPPRDRGGVDGDRDRGGDGGRRRRRSGGDDADRGGGGRRRRGGSPDREKKKKATDHMSMMRGMMSMPGMAGMANPMMAWQMGMMRSMMPGMQQGMPGMMPGMQMPTMQKSKKKKSQKTGSSSSSSSSSSGSGGGQPAAPAMFPGMGMMPGMMPGMMGMMAPLPPPPPMGQDARELENFLVGAESPVSPDVAGRFRSWPPHMQQMVMRRGSLAEARDPTSVLLGRMQEVESNPGGGGGGARPGGYPGGTSSRPSSSSRVDDMPARKSAKLAIERMIGDYRLPAGTAWMLRSLNPTKLKQAAMIDPAGQLDPAGYIEEQLVVKQIVDQ